MNATRRALLTGSAFGLISGFLIAGSFSSFRDRKIAETSSSSNHSKRDGYEKHNKLASASVRTRLANFANVTKIDNRCFVSRTRHKSNVDANNIYIEYWNGYVKNNRQLYLNRSPETNCDICQLRAAVVYNLEGEKITQKTAEITRATWFTMADDKAFIDAGGKISDDGFTITVPSGFVVRTDFFKELHLRKGEVYFVQWEDVRLLSESSNGVDSLRPYNDFARPDLGEAALYNPGDWVFDLDWKEAATKASPICMPSFIWCTTQDRNPVVLVDGDSIISEAADSGDADGAKAFAKRALNSVGLSYYDLSIPGTNMGDIFSYDAFAVRSRWVKYAELIISNHGNNDLSGNGFFRSTKGPGLLELIERHNFYLRSLTQNNVRIVRTTLQPRTSSEDGWSTTAGQRYRNADDEWPSGARAVWREYVTSTGKYINKAPSADAGDLFFDFYGALGAKDGKWPVTENFSPHWATNDGTHPNEILHHRAAILLVEWIQNYLLNNS